ncbi:MAG: RES family NAD+ phosphorylase [Gammaproteobacteria bacterium]
MSASVQWPRSRIIWSRSARIVPSRFPPVGPFDRVAEPRDLETVFAIESLTNDRLREAWGQLALVPPDDRVSGPGTTPIMAAFTHPSTIGSRFAAPGVGVYYAAKGLETAVIETVFQHERFLRASVSPAGEFDMRVYYAPVLATLCDLRPLRARETWLYDPDPAHYPRTQALAGRLRAAGEKGLVYQSVRDLNGECVALFRPRLVGPCTQGEHLTYVWDGRQITNVYIKSPYNPR